MWEWGAYYGDAKMRGAKLDISEWKRPSPEKITSFAKASVLYVICTMSKHAAEANGCSDAIMLDWRGYVAEATGENVFFVLDEEVHTPLPDGLTTLVKMFYPTCRNGFAQRVGDYENGLIKWATVRRRIDRWTRIEAGSDDNRRPLPCDRA